MKKIIFTLIIILTVALPVSAQQEVTSYENDIGNIISQYGLDFEKIKEYPFETLYDTAKTAIKNTLHKSLQPFYKVTAVIIITSFINLFNFDYTNQVTKIINIISVAVIFYSVFGVFMEITKEISSMLTDTKHFITAFIPVFAGVSLASGQIAASAVYTGIFLICMVAVANFCINYIVPSINIFLAAGITSSVSQIVNLKPICELYHKGVKIAMTASVSVICFILSLQSTIAQGHDTLALKAGKMLVTSAVPIIGSALEGAVSSVYASIGILKSFCGIAGIAVILNIFLPAVVKLAASWLCYQLMIALGRIMENDASSDLLECFKNVTEILLSMSVLFSVLLIFSLTIMIKTTGAV